ncbi:Uncharacterised protein [Chlamydia trachomatis]|nr:Uncharacterised protein [Chlamydia trachomatis]
MLAGEEEEGVEDSGVSVIGIDARSVKIAPPDSFAEFLVRVTVFKLDKESLLVQIPPPCPLAVFSEKITSPMRGGVVILSLVVLVTDMV